MRKKWTVYLVNEERTWGLSMGAFRKRKNAVDFAVTMLEDVELGDGYVDGQLEAVVTWTG